MIRIEPSPGGDAIVIVVKNPLQALDVGKGDLVHVFWVFEIDFELVLLEVMN